MAEFGVQDDGYWQRLVSMALERTEERTVVEAELKRAVGLVGKAGHRVWRRVRDRMTNSGSIDVFMARWGGMGWSGVGWDGVGWGWQRLVWVD